MDKSSINLRQQLIEEIKRLLARTTVEESIKKEVLGCLPTASIAKLARLKFSLLIHLLVEAQKETIDKFREEKRSLATMDDLNEMAKETFSLVRKKEDEAISTAEAVVIGKEIKVRKIRS